MSPATKPDLRPKVSYSRSRACRPCRAAKVKCGDQRPACHRCVKHGRKCEYPDPLDLNFRSENDKAAERSELLWRQRSAVRLGNGNGSTQAASSRTETLPSQTGRESSSSSASSVIGLPVADADVSEDTRHAAITRFFQDFGCTSKMKTPWLDFFRLLPKFYAQASHVKEDSPIANTILALSLAYLSRVGTYPGCEIMARTEYCKAISKINAHLQGQVKIPINELLTSVSLMGFFESLMAPAHVEEANPREKVFAHLRGAVAMVRMIEMQPLETQDIDPSVLNIVYFQTVITCIRNRVRPPVKILTWSKQVDTPHSQHPGASILYLMYQVACWQVDMDTIIATNSVDFVQPHQAEAQVVEMMAILHSADLRVLQWESNLPPHLHFQTRDLNNQGDKFPLSRNHDLLSLPGAPRTIYTFRTCWATSPRVLAFVIRAVLHRNIIKCCTWLAQWKPSANDLLSRIEVSRTIIVHMIEQISCCINSFLMDSFIIPFQVYQKPPHEYEHERDLGKSMRLLSLPWPLSVATVALGDDHILQAVGYQRAQWLKDVLDYVHEQLGVRQPLLREPSPQIYTDSQASLIDPAVLATLEEFSLHDACSSQDGFGDY